MGGFLVRIVSRGDSGAAEGSSGGKGFSHLEFSRRRPSIGQERFSGPPLQVPQDLIHHWGISDETDDLHPVSALRTQEWILQIHLRDELLPSDAAPALERCRLLLRQHPQYRSPILLPGPPVL